MRDKTDLIVVIATALVVVGFSALGALEPLWVAGGLAAVVFLCLVSRTYKKFIRGRLVSSAPWIPSLVIFPLACSLRSVSMRTALVVMAVLFLITYMNTRVEGRFSNKLPLIFLLGGVIMVTVQPSSWQVGSFLVLAFMVLLRATNGASRHSAVTSLIDGVGLYLLVNVAAYHLLGMRSAAADLRTGGLEAADGGLRILYPLSSSLNLPPIMAAAFLAASMLLMERGARRVFRLIASAAAIVVLVNAESRTALIVAVAIAVSSLIAPRILRGLALPVTIGSLGFVFIYPAISKSIVAPIINGLTYAFPALSRGVGSSDVTLNGRDLIWSEASLFWVEKTSELGRAFGYGTQGQFKSGASWTYAHVFGSSISEPYLATTHNTVLQQVFDAGILGAVCLCLAIIACVRIWAARSRANEPYSAAGMAMSVSLVISSVTEVSLAPGVGQETFFVFVGLLVVACAGKPDNTRGLVLDGRSNGVLPWDSVVLLRRSDNGIKNYNRLPLLEQRRQPLRSE